MSLAPVLGERSWTPRAHQAGVHPVEIAVADATGASSVHAFERTIAAAPLPASSPRA